MDARTNQREENINVPTPAKRKPDDMKTIMHTRPKEKDEFLINF
jgi:hypothetical protein